MYVSKLTEKKGPLGEGPSAFPVVHVYLDAEHAQALQRVLEPFTLGKNKNHAALKAIFKDEHYFPQKILSRLEALRDEKHCRTVFMLHGLPEITPREVTGTPIVEREFLQNLLMKESYAVYISQGIGLALGLKPTANGNQSLFALVRYSGDSAYDGSSLHKHDEAVTTLSGLYSHGEKTRFTDWESLLREVSLNPEYRDIEIECSKTGTTRMTLAKFAEKFSQWKHQYNFEIDATSGHEDRFEELLARHSQHVHVGHGDMAMWSNDGPLLHQALPSEKLDGPPRLRRVAVGRAMNRA
ncbi:MAG: hypothetical protein EBV03_08205 [Proteobacteria bacterium]|nr:hypothetical protein [Pseudomonadota bacterium]